MILAIKYVDSSAEIDRKLPVAAAKARCNTLSAITESPQNLPTMHNYGITHPSICVTKYFLQMFSVSSII